MTSMAPLAPHEHRIGTRLVLVRWRPAEGGKHQVATAVWDGRKGSWLLLIWYVAENNLWHWSVSHQSTGCGASGTAHAALVAKALAIEAMLQEEDEDHE